MRSLNVASFVENNKIQETMEYYDHPHPKRAWHGERERMGMEKERGGEEWEREREGNRGTNEFIPD